MTEPDPTQLPLHELRALRADLHAHDDVVSYVRRVAQARLDLVEAEIRHRAEAKVPATPAELHEDMPAELRNVLGHHLTGGPARPPRPADDASEHPLALELEAMCNRHGMADLGSLDDAELADLHQDLRDFEQRSSHDRQDLFARIDALSAELVRRYRDGEADVDGLLADG